MFWHKWCSRLLSFLCRPLSLPPPQDPVQYFSPQGPGHAWLSLAHEVRADVASLGLASLANFLDRRIIKGLAEGATERAEPGQNPLTLRYEDPILETRALDLTYTAARQKRFWACCTVLAGAFSCLTMVPRSAWPWASYWIISTAAMMAIARGWVRRGPKLGSALSEASLSLGCVRCVVRRYVRTYLGTSGASLSSPRAALPRPIDHKANISTPLRT